MSAKRSGSREAAKGRGLGTHTGIKPLLLLLVAVVVSAAVPTPLDPLKVAPHIYELEFQNERVRVIKQTLRNGETQPLHAHPDRLLVYLQTCAWIEDDGAGGKRMQEFKYGDVVWADAETHGGTNPEVVQECKILEIEFE